MNEQGLIITNGSIKIDLNVVYEVCGSERDLIQKLIITFLNGCPIIAQKFTRSVAAKDFDTIFKTAHLARSALSIIRVELLLETLGLIEKHALAGEDIVILENLINRLNGMYIEVRDLLKVTLFELEK